MLEKVIKNDDRTTADEGGGTQEYANNVAIGLGRARLSRKLVFCFQSVFPRLDPCGEVKTRPYRFRPPYRISNQPSSRSIPRARIDAVRIDDCAARVFENTRRSAWCHSRLRAVAPPVGTRRE